jgi:dihydroorotase-like cyclic amidohydrolase
VVNHDREWAADVLVRDGLIAQVAQGIQVSTDHIVRAYTDHIVRAH